MCTVGVDVEWAVRMTNLAEREWPVDVPTDSLVQHVAGYTCEDRLKSQAKWVISGDESVGAEVGS